MYFAHPTSDVQTVQIGENTRIWQFCVISENVKIGSNCNICSGCFIEQGVIIGNNVTIKNGVYLYTGLIIGDNVFIGPNVTFTNDKYPKSKKHPEAFLKTHIYDNVSIGGGSVILPGISIGSNAMIGAGSVVTKNISKNMTAYGNPAKVIY